MSDGVKPGGLAYVNKVNGDAGVRSVSFEADRCGGNRTEVPVMSTPAVTSIFGVTMAVSLYTMVMGGRYK